MRWALVGPGRIAHAFTRALASLPDAELAAVIGRDAGRARAFAQAAWPAERTPPDVATELTSRLAQGDIDAVYVATPHAQHAEAVAVALQAGCGVLCEKSLTPGHAQAAPLVALARERGVFLMEAVWTRFLPAYGQVQRWLAEGAIGRLRGVQSTFCFHTPFDPASRVFDPALAGGALLDIGIYNLTVTRWALQQALGHVPEPQAVSVHGHLAATGVDQTVAATLDFGQGLVAQFTCSVQMQADNTLRLMGDEGCIVLPQRFWMAERAELHRGGQAPVVAEAPFDCNGLEYEITEAMRCIRAGRVESPVMPLDESLDTLRWMDQLRAQLGVRYPWE